MVLYVGAFFISWAPFYGYRLSTLFYKIEHKIVDKHIKIALFSLNFGKRPVQLEKTIQFFLASIHSVLNPVIYMYTNKNCWRAVIGIVIGFEKTVISTKIKSDITFENDPKITVRQWSEVMLFRDLKVKSVCKQVLKHYHAKAQLVIQLAIQLVAVQHAYGNFRNDEDQFQLYLEQAMIYSKVSCIV